VIMPTSVRLSNTGRMWTLTLLASTSRVESGNQLLMCDDPSA
jgi:hypothetical protein